MFQMMFGQIFTSCRSSSNKDRLNIDRIFEVKLDFEDIKVPDKIEKKNSFGISKN